MANRKAGLKDMGTKRVVLMPAMLVLVAAFGLFLWQAAPSAQAQAEDDPGKILTIGRAEITAIPDTATVIIGVTSLEPTAAKAQSEAARQMVSLRKALRELNIPDQAMQTRNFNVGPEYEYNDGQRKLVGYGASHDLYVKLDDVDVIGKVLDEVVNAGASQVREVQFGLKDSTKLMQQALEQAVKDAKIKAESLAAGAGVKVVRIVRIQDQSSGGGVIRPVRDMATFAMAKSEVGTPVAVGEITVRADVEVEFEFH
jgi:uncharacterized protein YggE